MESVSIDKTTLILLVGATAILTMSVYPNNAANKSVTWTSSNPSVASVDQSGKVTAVGLGKSSITVTTVDGAKTATCEVTVKETATIPNGRDYVDLGLPSGLKWASMNIGATKPEEYGDYFAWGETQPKTDYSWLTYKFRVSGNSWDTVKFNKYCTKSSYWDSSNPMDNKTVLDSEDDAAHVNWGGSWRMPTKEEQDELMTKCTWTRTTQNGVNGRLVTGPNGNSIFLPAAGDRIYTNLYDTGSCNYWSSSLITGGPNSAYDVYFDSGNVIRGTNVRYYGFSVRPVTE